MVQDVDVMGTSITGDKQIAIRLRHNGQGNSPDLTVDAGAIKFQFHKNVWGCNRKYKERKYILQLQLTNSV